MRIPYKSADFSRTYTFPYVHFSSVVAISLSRPGVVFSEMVFLTVTKHLYVGPYGVAKDSHKIVHKVRTVAEESGNELNSIGSKSRAIKIVGALVEVVGMVVGDALG